MSPILFTAPPCPPSIPSPKPTGFPAAYSWLFASSTWTAPVNWPFPYPGPESSHETSGAYQQASHHSQEEKHTPRSNIQNIQQKACHGTVQSEWMQPVKSKSSLTAKCHPACPTPSPSTPNPVCSGEGGLLELPMVWPATRLLNSLQGDLSLYHPHLWLLGQHNEKGSINPPRLQDSPA